MAAFDDAYHSASVSFHKGMEPFDFKINHFVRIPKYWNHITELIPELLVLSSYFVCATILSIPIQHTEAKSIMIIT